MGAFVKKIKLFITVGLLVYSFNPIHSNNDTGLGKTGTLTAEEYNIIAEKLFFKRPRATDFVPTNMVIGLLNEFVMNNDLETVKFFLNKGIDINLTDESGNTPLYIAGLRSNPAMVKLLLEAGANPNGTDDKRLPSYRANPGVLGIAINTPLHGAARGGKLENAKILLDHGADIDMQNKDGNTALHFAVLGWNSIMVKFLLSAGADRYIRNKLDWTPLDLAKRSQDYYGNTNVMSVIIKSLTNDSWFPWLW